MPLVLDHDYCPNGWAGCDDNYTGGHYCERERDHRGRCACGCGATTTKRGDTGGADA